MGGVRKASHTTNDTLMKTRSFEGVGPWVVHQCDNWENGMAPWFLNID